MEAAMAHDQQVADAKPLRKPRAGDPGDRGEQQNPQRHTQEKGREHMLRAGPDRAGNQGNPHVVAQQSRSIRSRGERQSAARGRAADIS
jgi:hypothetical protein